MSARIAVIIPARFASTRFPGKPLHPLAGKPMIQHVWERVSRASGIGEIHIATDDARIAEAALSFDARVLLTSPRCVSGTDRVAEAARSLPGYTHYINVQGDEPLIEPRTITALATALAEDPNIPLITAASPFSPGEDPANPNAVKVVIDAAGDALYFSRSPIPYQRQSVPGLRLLRHQGIYGYRQDVLAAFVRWRSTPLERAESLEQLRALEHGVKIRVLRVKHLSPGVDTPEDAAAIEACMRHSLNCR